MSHQHAFDVERPDAVARHDDHVVVARREEVVLVRVRVSAVAGQPPAPVRGETPGRVRVAVVSGEVRQRAGGHVDRDPPGRPRRRRLVPVIVKNGAAEPGQRLPHRAGPDLKAHVVVPPVDDDHAVLGLTVVIADVRAKRGLRPGHDVGRQRLTR